VYGSGRWSRYVDDGWALVDGGGHSSRFVDAGGGRWWPFMVLGVDLLPFVAGAGGVVVGVCGRPSSLVGLHGGRSCPVYVGTFVGSWVV